MTLTEMNAIYEELLFWKGFVKTRRFLDGWVGLGKTPELLQFVADFILEHQHHRVLDVGSGAVSILNGLLRQSDLTPVDPLGKLYQLFFDYDLYQIQPPLAIPAEEITFENKFDIVHMSNVIDHVQNPYVVYQNLFHAVAPGGYLIIQGFEYEGKYEDYKGFHQWDFHADENNLYVNDAVVASNPYSVKRIKTEQNRDWYVWICQK